MQSSTATVRSSRLDFDEVRHNATGKWEGIINALAPSLRDAVQRAPRPVACPTHESKSRRPDGFRFHKTFRDTGRGGCNTCGWPGDGFAVLAQWNNWTIRETFEEVARYLGLYDSNRETRHVEPRAEVRPAEPPKPNEFFRKLLNETWKGLIPIDAPEAELVRRYLAKRKVLPPDLPQNVYFHPRLDKFRQNAEGRSIRIGSPPAMVAVLMDPDEKPITLHRTYLTMSGEKSPGDAKRMLPSVVDGTIPGGAIRLYPATEQLGLTEGIETALAVRCATGMPVWACYSTSLLTLVQIPDSVKDIVIWADSDENGAGQNAANGLLERLAKQGRTARVFYPADVHPEGKTDIDWADIYATFGPDLFPKL